MRRHGSLACITTLLFVTGIAVIGCQSPVDSPTGRDGDTVRPSKVTSRVTGGGHYLFGGALNIQFSMSAAVRDDGKASGSFHETVTLGGLLIDIHGTVTCLSVDAENGRAWIGGVVTENNSEHPDFQGDIMQPGRDVWFRVLDTGDSGEPDRLTFLGFEGGGGIITSEEYCEAQIWPDENARTHPVTSGQITLTP